MPRYTITESVGNRVEHVRSFEDLEKHHPSSGREPGRNYATIDGELEEVRLQNGRTYVKKDFILSQDTAGPVYIPAPVSGYVHHLNDATNAVRIYDQPFGTPGATMLAQSLHMARGTSPAQGAFVQYGAPLGQMGDTGSPGSTHAHVEVEVAQFRRYISDMVNGTIRPGLVDPLADGMLRHGEQGAPVRELQLQLSGLGFRDAQGNALEADGYFGDRTMEAVQAFQRSLGLEPDGLAARDTLAVARAAADPAAHAIPQLPPATQPQLPALQPPANIHTGGDHVSTPLSDLIGRGEGGYNAYNRGRAGDAGGREIDFSQMTVEEVMRRQALPRDHPESLFAIGKFQMIPGTLRETVDALGIDGSARFTPQLQERMFADYLVDEKRPAIHAYITGRSEGAQGLQRAQIALAQEFASVADPRTGRSYYEGDSAGNSASITAHGAAVALDAMRQQYQANIARGLAPDAAYRALSGAAPTQDAMVDGVLREGQHGDAVRTLQDQLNRLGVRDAQGRALAADGDFGRRTAEAVTAFQRSHALEPDGIVGRDTLGALRNASAEQTRLFHASPSAAPVAPAVATLADDPQPFAESTTNFVEKLLEAARRNDAAAIEAATRELQASQIGQSWQDDCRRAFRADPQQSPQASSHDPDAADLSR